MIFDNLLSKDERKLLNYCHKYKINTSPCQTSSMLAELNWSQDKAVLICKSLEEKGFIQDHLVDMANECTFVLSAKGMNYKNLQRQHGWQIFQQSILWPIVVGVLATLLTLLITKW